VKRPRVAVGEPFTETDFELADAPFRIEARAKARTATLLVLATIVFYGGYVAHEWLAGVGFETIGRFLESCLFMILGWCLGKIGSHDRAGP
jgi:hypothetical protein